MTALRAQLEAIRAGAVAQVAMTDAILAALAPEAVPVIVSPPAEGCQHPEAQRIRAPRMGAPGGWKCGVGTCGYEGGQG